MVANLSSIRRLFFVSRHPLVMRQNHGVGCDGAGSVAVGVNGLIQDRRLLVLHNLIPPDFDAATTANQLFHPIVLRADILAVNRCEVVFVALEIMRILVKDENRWWG